MRETLQMGDQAVEREDDVMVVLQFVRWAFEHDFKEEDRARKIQDAALWLLDNVCSGPGFVELGDAPSPHREKRLLPPAPPNRTLRMGWVVPGGIETRESKERTRRYREICGRWNELTRDEQIAAYGEMGLKIRE